MNIRRIDKDLEDFNYVINYLTRLVAARNFPNSRMKFELLQMSIDGYEIFKGAKWNNYTKTKQDRAVAFVRLVKKLNKWIDENLDQEQVKKMRTAVRQDKHKDTKFWASYSVDLDIKELLSKFSWVEIEKETFDMLAQQELDV